MGYETQRFLVVDTETTGLSLDRVRLLEIAAIPVVDGVICDKEIFHEIVNPGVVVPRSVSVLHGIRGETLVGKPRPRTILKSFLDFSRDSILVMQNGWFDIRVINKELWLAKLPPMRNPYIDTAIIARKIFGGRRNYSLPEILKRLGMYHNWKRHRALDDAWVTAEAFIKMMEILGGPNAIARFIRYQRRSHGNE